MAGGTSLSIWLAIFRQPPQRQVRNALLLLVVSVFAYLSAHVLYGVFEAERFPDTWSALLDFRQGGLSAAGALWGGVIGFLLACAAQQRQPFAALDEISAFLLPMGAFACLARWSVDRFLPAGAAAYAPPSAIEIVHLHPADLLLIAALVFLGIAWALEGFLRGFALPGIRGNMAFTLLCAGWALLESSYGFFRFHPRFSLALWGTLALPLFSWLLGLWLGRKAEPQ